MFSMSQSYHVQECEGERGGHTCGVEREIECGRGRCRRERERDGGAYELILGACAYS